jgi:succinylglutamic semialdehyde dehydrogenase
MSLRSEPVVGRGDLIDGEFHRVDDEAAAVVSRSPADLDDVIGSYGTDPARAVRAVEAAVRALPAWRRAPFAHRAACLERYRDALAARREGFAVAISRAVGKPLWESRTEADALVAKVNITLTAGQELVRPREVEPGAFVRHRPVGVCAVLGPFNFPAHLANGHIVPLLAAGNVVVFKPSEKAPAVGELMAECLLEAGFAPGVANVVQGGVACAERLVRDPRVDGVMFTGSTGAGRAILRASSDFPGRMLALEMGGNNPALVLRDADVPYAAREIAFSAFVTAGQRCTAVRRVLVHRAVAKDLLDRLVHAARHSVVGLPDDPEVFMGPVIQESARDEALALVERHRAAFEPLVALRARDVDGARGYYLGPGVYLAKGAIPSELGATEWFAPLVFVEVCDDDETMIARANDTRFGLAAAVFTRDSSRFRAVADELEAGVVNWNRGTVGSSSRLPFGGVKESGNHRPAGLYSALYCADPVAELHVAEPGVGATAPGLRFP